jgi:DNA-binding NarL/FixJ family response regulator
VTTQRDLLICEIEMPEGDLTGTALIRACRERSDLGLSQAFEGLRQVRERRPDVQVLAVTSDHAPADRTQAVELGVTAFVRSDATANEVADALELVAAASAAGLLSPARSVRSQAT